MRQYLIQQWNNADEYDYSGEMLGDRKRPSHFIGTSANIKAYAEAEEKPKSTAKKPSLKSLPEQRLEKLELKRSQLEKALASAEISEQRYNILITEWEKQYERAMNRLDKLEAEAAIMNVASIDCTHVVEKNNHKSFKNDFTWFAGLAIILATAMIMVS